MSKHAGFHRRDFLRTTALGAIGASALTRGTLLGAENSVPGTPGIREYRLLGRTGFKVSDISCGFVGDAGVLNALLDNGVNYIDTAESYENEELVGKVVKDRDRKKIFITSKLELKKEDLTKASILARARKCLERLQTEYLDCMMIHSAENREILFTDGFHEAMRELKSEGRVRYLGVSNHGSNWYRDPEETMQKVLTAAAEDGRFDVFLMAYNYVQQDMGAEVLELCRRKNIGTTLMKTNPVGQYHLVKTRVERLEKEGKEVHPLFRSGLDRLKQKVEAAQEFIQKYNLNNPAEIRAAALRFCLSNSNVSTVCIGFRNFEQVDEYMALSGSRLEPVDEKKLSAFSRSGAMFYCRHACAQCESSCPHAVPVNKIMRYNHYFDAQGREKEAMAKYQRLDAAKADLCRDCDGYCEAACPYGIPIQGLLNLAHRRLTLV
ncbi:MAG: aldo/keto reductase [Acidobacteria bacterium]|nr:aldo/keto reductase [Acidobacteriota bacterium]